jgi:hypothetical protein
MTRIARAEEFEHAVKFLICIQEVLGWNLGQDTAISIGVSPWFSQYLQDNIVAYAVIAMQ